MALMRLSSRSGSYELIEADDDLLLATLELMRGGEFDGLNITMPLKGAAARLMDGLTPVAARARSVNTVTVDGSRLTGHTSDGLAFAGILAEEPFSQASTVYLLGAGGSARAVAAAVSDGVELCVSARRPEAARSLADEFDARVVRWGAAVDGSVVVNCTPLGMHGESIPDAVLRAAGGLVDLPYGTEPTPSVRVARRLALPVVDGGEFLMRQAIESFRLWTGANVPLGDVIEALRIS